MTERIDIVVSERGGTTVRRRLDDIGTGAERTGKQLEKLKKLFGALFAGALFADAIRSTVQFQSAIAEVSTLVNTATFNMKGLTEAALENAKAFGKPPVEQAKAFYQIISAGASTAAEAQETLTAANKLAVGGVTDVATAADGLTSVLNAYGDKIESATAASDAMFVAMRAGKTTIGELSSSLGKVAPLAAQAGVSFEELLSSVAALTKGGISTTESVTGIRAVMAAVVKPTQEATELARQLGVEFNAAALESRGLAGFLESLVTATNGSTEKLGRLFGGVEALVPILALTGQAGVDFTNILGDMANKAGETEEAFNKMASSPGFQIDRVMASFRSETIALSSNMVTMLVPALAFVADHMDVLLRVVLAVVLALGTQFAVNAVGAAIRAIARLTIAIAANPIGAIVVVITAATAALIAFSDQLELTSGSSATALDFIIVAFQNLLGFAKEAISGVLSLFGDFQETVDNFDFLTFVKGVAKGMDIMVGVFEGGFEGVKALVTNFPSVAGDILIKGINLLLKGLQKLPQALLGIFKKAFNFVKEQAVNFVNFLIETFNKVPGVSISLIDKLKGAANDILDDGRLTNPFEGAAEKVGEAALEGFNRGFERSLAQNAVDQFAAQAEQRAANRVQEEADRQNQFQRLTPSGGGTTPTSQGGGLPDPSAFDATFSSMSQNLGTLTDQFNRMQSSAAEIFGPGGSLSQGIGDAVAGAIVFGESFTGALKQIGKQIIASLISGIIQIGVNLLIQATIGKAIQAAMTASTAAAAGGLAAAWAPAATAANIATLGGAAAAGTASLGPALAVGTSLIASAGAAAAGAGAAAAGFREGGYTGNIGVNDVAGVVHGQEFVVNAAATKRNRPALEAMNNGGELNGGSRGGSGPVTLTYSPNITVTGSDVDPDRLAESMKEKWDQWLEEKGQIGGRLEGVLK